MEPTDRPSAPRGLAPLLAALAALGPFSIDAYLPSFADIGASLDATPLQVQQTLTAYLVPFTVMTLWHGALSDALGRRTVVLFMVALFALASAGCTLATQIEHLWLLRALQGVAGGAGMVICRAIVRDLYGGPPAQRMIAQVMVLFSLAPVLAPVLGGWLQVLLGWRAVFAFLALLGVALWATCWWCLPETLPAQQRQPLRPGYLLRSYREVLNSPPFMLICGALAFNFAAFFIYILSAPVFLMRHLGLPATGFLWLFGPAMGGLMLGAWLSGRAAGSLSPTRTIVIAYLLMAVAAVGNIVFNLVSEPRLPWSVLPIFGFTLGMSLAIPGLTVQALDLFPAKRGLAASCQGFLQAGCNTLAAALIAPVLWESGLTLAVGMGVLCLLGAFATVLHGAHQRRAPAAG